MTIYIEPGMALAVSPGGALPARGQKLWVGLDQRGGSDRTLTVFGSDEKAAIWAAETPLRSIVPVRVIGDRQYHARVVTEPVEIVLVEP